MGRDSESVQKDGVGGIFETLLTEGKVAVSPGIGFGEYGEGFVRFALVENENRIKQAVKGIQRVLKKGIIPNDKVQVQMKSK